MTLMKNSFVLGTFYTIDTPYEDVFNKYFLPSAMSLFREHGVEWKVFPIENKGSWIKNVAEKPRVILEMLDSINKDKNLVFLDSDAEIHKYPELFDKLSEIEYDIAYHELDWESWYRNGSSKRELLSGTLFFKNNAVIRDLLNEWYIKASSTDIWEQQVLENILKQRTDIKKFELPIEYCYIDSLPWGGTPHVVVEEPVITHYQASRKLKKLIK